MIKHVILITVMFLIAIPLWAQTDATDVPSDEGPMMTPPPVSGMSYPITIGSEKRSNYLGLGISGMAAMNDNVLAGSQVVPTTEQVYTISPQVSFDQSTARFHRLFSYNPVFTFYEPTSSLNAIDQSASGALHYSLTPHSGLSVSDTFYKTTNIFNQPAALTGGGVSGGVPSQASSVIAPFAEEVFNSTGVEYSVQFSRSGMIGFSGEGIEMDFPNPSDSVGLFNSNSAGGSAFYSLRASARQYAGVSYQYLRVMAYPPGPEAVTQTDAIFPFYTIFLRTTLSLSVSGGPQYFEATYPGTPTQKSWEPAITASMGWQGQHTSLAASYSRSVAGGGGLLGAFKSDNAGLTGRWQMLPRWSVSLSGNYTNNKTLTPGFVGSTPGGHTFAGILEVDHPITDHLTADGGYDRLQVSYTGIQVVNGSPNSDLVYFGMSYQLRRPLGR